MATRTNSAVMRIEKTPPPAAWGKLKPKTLVERVIEALMAGAAQGLILSGDRLIETEIAQNLGVSRVPVREALRVLESQGVVVNEPYRGIRLMSVTAERIDNIIEVRLSLETAAAASAIRQRRNGADDGGAMDRLISEMERRADAHDLYGFATADTKFHRVMCGLAGNPVLMSLWDMLARQMTIIFGLAALGKPVRQIIEEHRTLLAIFRSGDIGATARAIEDHISVQTHAVDFDAIIARRRAEVGGAQAGRAPVSGSVLT